MYTKLRIPLILLCVLLLIPLYIPRGEQKITTKTYTDGGSKDNPYASTWIRVNPGESGVTIIDGVKIHILSPDGKPFECQDEKGYIEIRSIK